MRIDRNAMLCPGSVGRPHRPPHHFVTGHWHDSAHDAETQGQKNIPAHLHQPMFGQTFAAHRLPFAGDHARRIER